jgi:hypothetical protein
MLPAATLAPSLHEVSAAALPKPVETIAHQIEVTKKETLEAVPEEAGALL